jgi:hypothetical protein
VLRHRADAYPGPLQDGTSEPDVIGPPEQNRTNELPPRTSEPKSTTPGPTMDTMPHASCTREPAPRLNRHQRRVLAAQQRRRAA